MNPLTDPVMISYSNMTPWQDTSSLNTSLKHNVFVLVGEFLCNTSDFIINIFPEVHQLVRVTYVRKQKRLHMQSHAWPLMQPDEY